AYGCPWVNTPAFDAVAKGGVLFTRAYTPNAKCAPSRACILTGRNSWQLEEAANHIPFFPARFQSFMETLAEHGYHVGHTAKGWAPGKALDPEGRPRLLTGKAYNQRKAVPPAKHISDNDYAGNFEDFLDANPGQPFCFWFGCTEPHRGYEYQAGISKGGKRLEEIDRVPRFWPDTETVRTDMLDYAFEIEHFDRHLQRMLDLLEARGKLDNTIIVVTADNGMPFPRVKGQAYEYSNHMPLAISWKNGIAAPGRRVEDFVSFIDFAPTFLAAAGIDPGQGGMEPMEGRSLLGIFQSSHSGQVDPQRDFVLIGKERHDVGRPHDQGYPIRGIIEREFLYLRNFEPARWPAGNPETGYLNCDGSPTKTVCIEARQNPEIQAYWQMAFGKRKEEELYNIQTDPECLHNLARQSRYRRLTRRLEKRLMKTLRQQGDPRMAGRGAIFDEYPYADENTRGFYERYMAGEPIKAGWVNPSDFE
ncbi:MAG: sulfatase, partial [bacterium]|nr:sulfatase [bacterium]